MKTHESIQSVLRLRHPIAALLCSFGVFAFSGQILAEQFPTKHFVSDVTVDDVNHDGAADIVTCGSDANNDGSVNVLLGNGNGTFQSARQFPVGPQPGRIALGDFDGDGNLDVATANLGTDQRST